VGELEVGRGVVVGVGDVVETVVVGGVGDTFTDVVDCGVDTVTGDGATEGVGGGTRGVCGPLTGGIMGTGVTGTDGATT
jgi:hypothetical protein